MRSIEYGERSDLYAAVTSHPRQPRTGTPRHEEQAVPSRAAVVSQSDKHILRPHHQLLYHLILLRRKAIESVQSHRVSVEESVVAQQVAYLCQRVERIHIALRHDRVVCVVYQRRVAQLCAQGIVAAFFGSVQKLSRTDSALLVFLDGVKQQLACTGAVALIEHRQPVAHLL